MRRRNGFTLVELLVVIAIIAILYTILSPVFIQVKTMAQKYVAGQAMMKLGVTSHMYAADYDETLVPGYSQIDNRTRQNWFGITDIRNGKHPNTGLFEPYLSGRIQGDAMFNGLPYSGDETGYGYNWGYLGSDYYTDVPLSNGWYCVNPATLSTLAHPSTTIEFASSSFYYAKWLPRGDGNIYQYGFVDPPFMWHGNPTMDFRHNGDKHVDRLRHEVTSTGQALVVYADGHLKPKTQKEIKVKDFVRDETTPLSIGGWDE